MAKICFMSLLVCCDPEYQYSGLLISAFLITSFIEYLSQYTHERCSHSDILKRNIINIDT